MGVIRSDLFSMDKEEIVLFSRNTRNDSPGARTINTEKSKRYNTLALNGYSYSESNLKNEEGTEGTNKTINKP